MSQNPEIDSRVNAVHKPHVYILETFESICFYFCIKYDFFLKFIYEFKQYVLYLNTSSKPSVFSSKSMVSFSLIVIKFMCVCVCITIYNLLSLYYIFYMQSFSGLIIWYWTNLHPWINCYSYSLKFKVSMPSN